MSASLRLLLLASATAFACSSPPPQEPPPCEPRASFEATGFFRVEEECTGFLLVTPEGDRFYSTGVNATRFEGDHSPRSGTNPYLTRVRELYGDEETWAGVTAERLQSWGWNTVGAWSSHGTLGRRMPYTVILNLAGGDWRTGELPDYFAEEWATRVQQRAANGVVDPADPLLVGYFLDNELHWGPDWRLGTELFDEYLALPRDAPGRRALAETLRSRHDDIGSFNDAWRTSLESFAALDEVRSLPKQRLGESALADRDAFLRRVAERYFSVTTQAVRALDPNHLILGARLVAPVTPRVVVEAAGGFVDVMSVNAYEFALDPTVVWPREEYRFLPLDDGTFLRSFFEAGGRPVLVSEFGFRAADSGLPNSWPPVYPVLVDQHERADRFEAYARRCLEAPHIVGHHWFKYADQPPEGRFDGEDNNWGLVDLDDAPYSVLVERTAHVHQGAGNR